MTVATPDTTMTTTTTTTTTATMTRTTTTMTKAHIVHVNISKLSLVLLLWTTLTGVSMAFLPFPTSSSSLSSSLSFKLTGNGRTPAAAPTTSATRLYGINWSRRRHEQRQQQQQRRRRRQQQSPSSFRDHVRPLYYRNDTSASSYASQPVAVVAADGVADGIPVVPAATTTATSSSSTVVVVPTDSSSSPSSSASSPSSSCPLERFQREASRVTHLDEECILTIGGRRYNVTAYGHAHPGGANILMKFHGKDATKAFDAAGHSDDAYELLQQFLIVDDESHDDNTGDHSITDETSNGNYDNTNRQRQHDSRDTSSVIVPTVSTSTAATTTTATATTATTIASSAFQRRQSFRSRFRKKLFTTEDPVGVHKYLGIFCLLNFIGRFYQMYFGDPAAGLGRAGHPYFALLCLVPHGLLSVSSLIFHTVPQSRVVGKPMIWKEYRWHNIIFGLRSVVTAMAASLAIKFGNTPTVRFGAIVSSSACVLLSQYGADLATERLRANQEESTTATMPYWDGCSIETQRRFKSFYAYCQFMATLACLAVGNPAWPLSVLLAIQMASLLMTLVRKGLLSAKGYHIGYTVCLVLPYFVGLRSMIHSGSFEFPAMLILASALFHLRRRGVQKYMLWVPVILARLFVGDSIISSFQVW